jgi:exodeoxyribonuclease VII small subunit
MIHTKIQAMVKKTAKAPDFERSLKELEDLVEAMERGDLSLEESLKQFERGVQLSRSCQQALKTAEQKVEMLLQKNGQETITPFDSDDT